MDIAGQSFIVTGAAKGIGLAISTLFHSLGARVSGWDLDDSGMKDNPVFADSRIVDVTDPSQTEAGFAACLAVLGEQDHPTGFPVQPAYQMDRIHTQVFLGRTHQTDQTGNLDHLVHGPQSKLLTSKPPTLNIRHADIGFPGAA